MFNVEHSNEISGSFKVEQSGKNIDAFKLEQNVQELNMFKIEQSVQEQGSDINRYSSWICLWSLLNADEGVWAYSISNRYIQASSRIVDYGLNNFLTRQNLKHSVIIN